MAAARPDVGEVLQSIQAGKIASLYLLYGEEIYLQEQILSAITGRLVEPSTADLNVERLDAEYAEPEQIRNAVETLPFLGGRRLVIVRRAEGLEERLDTLREVLERPPASACLVLMASSLKEKGPLVKAVGGSGVVVSTALMKGRGLGTTVQGIARRMGFALDADALGVLLDRSGGSLQRAVSELQKLSLHVEPAGEGSAPVRLSMQTVVDVVDDGKTDNLFDLSDALGLRDGSKALISLRRLLRRQYHPTVIVGAMARHFIRLLEARAMLDQGVPKASVPKRMGGHPFYAKKLTEQASRFSDAELRHVIDLLQETDLLLKGNGPPDWALMERLVLVLCRKGGQTARNAAFPLRS